MGERKWDTYLAHYHDPVSGNRGRFQIKAVSPHHADVQARDGYFGLLAPPTAERRKELEVQVELCP